MGVTRAPLVLHNVDPAKPDQDLLDQLVLRSTATLQGALLDELRNAAAAGYERVCVALNCDAVVVAHRKDGATFHPGCASSSGDRLRPG